MRCLTLSEGEDLEFDAQVDGAHLDSRGDGEEARRKAEDVRDTRGDETIAGVLRGRAGGGDDTDLGASGHLGEIGE